MWAYYEAIFQYILLKHLGLHCYYGLYIDYLVMSEKQFVMKCRYIFSSGLNIHAAPLITKSCHIAKIIVHNATELDLEFVISRWQCT